MCDFHPHAPVAQKVAEQYTLIASLIKRLFVRVELESTKIRHPQNYRDVFDALMRSKFSIRVREIQPNFLKFVSIMIQFDIDHFSHSFVKTKFVRILKDAHQKSDGGSVRSDLKKLDSFTFETSKYHLIRNFRLNGRLLISTAFVHVLFTLIKIASVMIVLITYK